MPDEPSGIFLGVDFMNKNKWIWILIAAAVVVGYQKMQQGRQGQAADAVQTQTQPQTQAGKRQSEQSESKKSQPKQPKSERQAGQGSAEQILQQAFENQQSDIQVKGAGTVLKTLPDDNQGTRHQRFILKLSSGQTLLVAHNIDLADKIKGLKKGDKVVTIGGIHGVVSSVDEKNVIVKVDDATKIKFTRSAVAAIENPEAPAKDAKKSSDADAEKPSEEKK